MMDLFAGMPSLFDLPYIPPPSRPRPFVTKRNQRRIRKAARTRRSCASNRRARCR